MRISDWSSDVCSSDLIHVAGGELADFKEGRTSVEQALHAFAGQQLAPGDMTLPILLRSTESGLCHACMKFIPQGAVMGGISTTPVAARRHPPVKDGRTHAFAFRGVSRARSEERRLGKEGVSTCEIRWS